MYVKLRWSGECTSEYFVCILHFFLGRLTKIFNSQRGCWHFSAWTRRRTEVGGETKDGWCRNNNAICICNYTTREWLCNNKKCNFLGVNLCIICLPFCLFACLLFLLHFWHEYWRNVAVLRHVFSDWIDMTTTNKCLNNYIATAYRSHSHWLACRFLY